jgi:hypothetical protein
MKNLLLTLILVFSSLSFWGLDKSSINTDYKSESTVVLNIKNHTADEVQSAHDLLLKNGGIAIEYKCLASGVIVFKLSHNFTHEADVKMIVYKALNSILPMKRIAIVFVDIHSKTSQC